MEKDKILHDIKSLLLDFKKFYGDHNIKVIFNLPGQSDNPDKIKTEITETLY